MQGKKRKKPETRLLPFDKPLTFPEKGSFCFAKAVVKMMRNSQAHKLVLAGLLTALGVLFPYAVSHAFGVPGTVLLPMHIPVFLIGFLCGPMYGMLGGLLIPALSSLLTGMPAAFPMLPIMACELCAYGALSGLFYRRLHWPLYAALLLAMLGGRAAYGAMYYALLLAGGGALKALSVWGAVQTGLPGIALQLAVVPVRVVAARRYLLGERKTLFEGRAYRRASALIEKGRAACVLLQEGRIVYSAEGHGVKPLIAAYESDQQLLQGAVLVDRVIGKAAAMLAVLGGVKGVYGFIMSQSAKEYLQRHGVAAECGSCVTVIKNRTGDDLCPLEKSVQEIEDPAEGYVRLKETIRVLMSGSAQP